MSKYECGGIHRYRRGLRGGPECLGMKGEGFATSALYPRVTTTVKSRQKELRQNELIWHESEALAATGRGTCLDFCQRFTPPPVLASEEADLPGNIRIASSRLGWLERQAAWSSASTCFSVNG